MFITASNDGFRELLPGIALKTLAYGEKTLMVEFRLAQKCTLPGHAHPHEQTGYLVSGRIRLTIGDEIFEVNPGDSWCVPAGIKHGAEIIDDAVAVEVFSPVREDYLP